MPKAPKAGDDAYRVFLKMLESGQPPDDWERLLAQARAQAGRVERLASQLP